MSLMQEFRTFAVKGNMVDMAVGIIVGVAFGKIVSSFVGDVIMPPLGLIIGGVDFSDLAIALNAPMPGKAAVIVKYGNFIQTVVDFTIVVFAIFIAVKVINTLKKKEQAEPAALSKEQQLLTDIRDLLRERR